MSRLSSVLRSIVAEPTSTIAAAEPSRPQLDPRWDWQCLPLLLAGFPIAVCWSAKAGCTTVLKWFLEHNGLLEEATAHSWWVHDYREQRLCALHDYRRSCELLFSQARAGKYIVKVIRDPARRAVSGYLHLLRKGHEAAWPAGATVDRWKMESGLGGQRGISFRQFLRFLADEQARGRAIDPHFRPQFEPLQDPRVHAYIPLELLAAGLRDLECRFCLPHVDVRGLSDSFHHNPASARCHWPEAAATVPATLETLETLGTPSAEAFLDPETLASVHEVYRADYDAYGSVYPAKSTRQATRTAA
ncbi:MAG: hypothetical protein EBR28_09790 [Planctomycetia bacterium]|nr:hypothetical protein [Planctomycetia bacterium]